MSNEIKGVGSTLRQVSELVSTVRSARGLDSARGSSRVGVDALGDSVALTQTVARLRTIEARLAEVPIVDPERVLGIRQAMTEGSYDVVPAVVADKLLGFEYQRHAAFGPPE